MKSPTIARFPIAKAAVAVLCAIGLSAAHANPATAAENITRPAISGTPQQGETLTVDPGTWSGDVSGGFSYEWLRCNTEGAACTAIPGASGPAHALVLADTEGTIVVKVGVGSVFATSQPTPVVLHAPPSGGRCEAIPGYGDADETVFAVTCEGWSDFNPYDPLVYTWQWWGCDADGQNCFLEHQSSSTVPRGEGKLSGFLAGDSGDGSGGAISRVTVRITASDGSHTTWGSLDVDGPGTIYLATDATPHHNPLKPPAVSGNAWPGQTLTATPGEWSNAPTSVTHEWYRCESEFGATFVGHYGIDPHWKGCMLIPDSAGSSYVVRPEDRGSALMVMATATNAAGSRMRDSATTRFVTHVPPANSVLPAVILPGLADRPRQGMLLTAADGTWAGVNGAIAYRWERCDVGDEVCEPIPGATDQQYRVQPADAGSTIAVRVSATNVDATSHARSLPTGAVLALNADLSTLSVSAGSLSPPFAAATGSYTLRVPHETNSIDVTATAADAGATIRVDGAVAVSGSSVNRPLNVGGNSLTVLVTAEDDTVSRSYVVIVTRAAAPPAPDPKPDPEPDPKPTPDATPDPPAAPGPVPLPGPAPSTIPASTPIPQNGPGGQPRLASATVTAPELRWRGRNPQGRLWLTFLSSRKAKLKVTLQVRAGGRWKRLAHTTRTMRRGTNRVQLTGRWRDYIKPGRRLRLTVQPKVRGKKWPTRTVPVTVVPKPR